MKIAVASEAIQKELIISENKGSKIPKRESELIWNNKNILRELYEEKAFNFL